MPRVNLGQCGGGDVFLPNRLTLGFFNPVHLRRIPFQDSFHEFDRSYQDGGFLVQASISARRMAISVEEKRVLMVDSIE
jgi:hypothetical protein